MIETPAMLISDDDRDLRETLSGVFQSQGFETIATGNGMEALEVIQQRPIHVMLLDMHMPRLTGLETIRRSRRLGNIPSILMSAALDESITEAAREVDVFSVLSKPVSCRELTGLVLQAMRDTYDWP